MVPSRRPAIPDLFTKTWQYSTRGDRNLQNLISKHYEEPVDGNFTDVTAAIFAGMASTDDESNADKEEEDTVPIHDLEYNNIHYTLFEDTINCEYLI